MVSEGGVVDDDIREAAEANSYQTSWAVVRSIESFAQGSDLI